MSKNNFLKRNPLPKKEKVEEDICFLCSLGVNFDGLNEMLNAINTALKERAKRREKRRQEKANDKK